METTYISHLRAITPIRDSIHDSIRITLFEREIIDSPYFQRLHFILQNSTTFAAYPANKTSRFVHSLGVSYVAGALLTRAVCNAAWGDLDLFLNSIASFITDKFVRGQKARYGNNTYQKNLIDAWRSTIFGQSRFQHSPFLPHDANQAPIGGESGYKGFPALFLIDTVWEAIRICGLAHDIGHLPMSHSFEGALDKVSILISMYDKREEELGKPTASEEAEKPRNKYKALMAETETEFLISGQAEGDDAKTRLGDYIALLMEILNIGEQEIFDFLKAIPLHERRSLIILNLINEENRFEHKGATREYRHLILFIAFFILCASAADKSHDLAKRSDTSTQIPGFLRVLKSIIAGEIDADRLDYTVRDGRACGTEVGAFDLNRIINNSILIHDKAANCFRIAYYIRALSGIEQFFHQRHEGYKYLIYHRTSSRTEACLQELIARLIHISLLYPASKIAERLASYGYILRDDLGEAVSKLLPADKDTLSRMDDANLRTMLFEILSILRRPGGLGRRVDADLISPIKSLLEIVLLREFSNIYNPFKKEDVASSLSKSLGGQLTKSKYLACIDRLSDPGLRQEYSFRLKYDTLKHFGGKISAITNFQMPKIFHADKVEPDDQICIIKENGVAFDISDISASLKTMHSRALEEMNIRIYFVGERIKQDEQLVKRIDQFVDQSLTGFFRELAGDTHQPA